MNINLAWSDFKSNVTGRSIGIQYVTTTDYYYLLAFDGDLCFVSKIALDGSDDTNKADFETNFKSSANKNVIKNTSVQAAPPFGSKTIMINGTTHDLYARFTGAQFAVNSGANTLTYTATYSWAKIIGVEVINATALDYADLQVYDTAAGTYSGVPNKLLNQFAYTLNIAPGFYQKTAQFDADLYVGMIIQINYHSAATSSNTIGVNFLLNEVK